MHSSFNSKTKHPVYYQTLSKTRARTQYKFDCIVHYDDTDLIVSQKRLKYKLLMSTYIFCASVTKGVNIVVEIKHFAEATQRYGFHMQRSCLTIFDNIDPRANELTNSSSKSTLSLITSRENKKANTLCKKSLSV